MIKEPDKFMAPHWVADFSKVLATRDTVRFDIQRTAKSVHMAVLLKQDIILFEWAAEPYSKFMKVKAFWLPETPKFVSLQHDMLEPTFLIVGYASELNAVRISDAEVSDLPVPGEIRAAEGEWEDMIPLLHPDDNKVEATNVFHGTARKAAVVRAGQTGTALRDHASSRVKAKYYLATYGNMSSIVDSAARPVKNLPNFTRKEGGPQTGAAADGHPSAPSPETPPAPVFRWSATPSSIICNWSENDPSELIAFLGKGGVEVCSFRTGRRVTVFPPGAPVRLIAQSRDKQIFFASGKSRKRCSLHVIKLDRLAEQRAADA
ncbi:MAG: hypothetical protein BJ554DRAFT_2186 [Olpidium bornovanus]|uniref:CNH domain-containing protein n=1 Tax=Olpidium bornovanus TaxID=278681 RepID=A0A8H8A230_9FUNG|nr:MAG: hypothetical protein BJ554DRAFT_2186 [Olpidium bornovanus]